MIKFTYYLELFNKFILSFFNFFFYKRKLFYRLFILNRDIPSFFAENRGYFDELDDVNITVLDVPYLDFKYGGHYDTPHSVH